MGESKVRGGKIRFGLSLWGGLGGAGNGNRNPIGVLIGVNLDSYRNPGIEENEKKRGEERSL